MMLATWSFHVRGQSTSECESLGSGKSKEATGLDWMALRSVPPRGSCKLHLCAAQVVTLSCFVLSPTLGPS